MEKFAEEGKTVGIVFDISLRHDSNGNRLLDEVKKSIVDLINKTFENGIDMLYLYHPELVEVLEKQGDQTSAINNYDTDGFKFNLENALKQTIYLISNNCFDSRRYLILLTDRILNTRPIEKLILINKKDFLNVNLIVVSIGNFCNKDIVFDDVFHIHLDKASDLIGKLIKETDGRKDFYG